MAVTVTDVPVPVSTIGQAKKERRGLSKIDGPYAASSSASSARNCWRRSSRWLIEMS